MLGKKLAGRGFRMQLPFFFGAVRQKPNLLPACRLCCHRVFLRLALNVETDRYGPTSK